MINLRNMTVLGVIMILIGLFFIYHPIFQKNNERDEDGLRATHIVDTRAWNDYHEKVIEYSRSVSKLLHIQRKGDRIAYINQLHIVENIKKEVDLLGDLVPYDKLNEQQ